MATNSEAVLNHRYFEMIKLLNIYLNHFPRYEKFALANNIRITAYEIYDLITECQKRYFKKTSLTQLDVTHEKLRMQIYLANELDLNLSHWHIQKIKKGINFVGYRTWKKIKFVRKHSIYKMKKAIKN